MAILTAVFLMPSAAWGDLLLNENFDYATGNLYQCGKAAAPTTPKEMGWIKYSTNAQNPIQVVNTPLTYTGYLSNNTGKAAKLQNLSTTDEDLALAFTDDAITSGAIYTSFLIKVANASSANTYFLTFIGNTASNSDWMTNDGKATSEKARVFILAGSDASHFKLGVNKDQATVQAAETTGDYACSETHLVVLKYQFNSGSNDDVVSMWVDPTNLTSEPITTFSSTRTADATTRGLMGVELRQGQAYSKYIADITIDALRVATTWADLFSDDSEEEEGGEPETTPTLTVSASSLDFGSFFQGQAESKTFTVSGENLIGDVTLSLTNPAAQNSLILDKTTITLAELAGGPVTVTVSVKSERTMDFSVAQIAIASEGAESKTISAKGKVLVQTNEDVPMFSWLHNNAGNDWTTTKFTYTGTNAKIASYDEDYHTITLRDASNKNVIVEIPDANWEHMPLIIGLKVVEFTFTATAQSGILGTQIYATPITLLFDYVFAYNDETSASELNEEAGQSASVAVTRNLIFSSYNTICLPFSMSAQEVEDIFGTNTSILSLTSSSLSENEITLDFAVCERIDAGVPYLIKPAATVEGWLKSSTLITATPIATETSVVNFIGVLTPTVVEASEGNLFLGAGNTLYYNQAQGTLKGMRAYFQVVEPSAVGAPARIRTANETATGIESTFNAERAQKLLNEGRVIIRIDGHDYDLNGTMIR